MASQEELTPQLPDTLPEDFGEWDSEASPEAAQPKQNEWDAWEADHSFGENRSPNGQSAHSSPVAAPPVEKPRAPGSAPSAHVVAPEQKHFIEWEEEPAPTPKPADLSEWEAWEAAHFGGKTQKSAIPSADRNAGLQPAREVASAAAEKPRISAPPPAPTAPLKQHEPLSKPLNGANGSGVHASPAVETNRAAKVAPPTPDSPKPSVLNGKLDAPEAAKPGKKENEPVLQLFGSTKTESAEEPKSTAKKKWMIIAPASAGALGLLLLVAIPMLHHGAKPAAKPTVQPPTTTDIQQEPEPANPTDGGTATPDRPTPAAATPQAPANPAPGTTNAVKPASGPTRKQAKMMDDQLTAPTVIPQSQKVAENAPPPVDLGAAGADGLGGASASDAVLGGHAPTAIKIVPSRPFSISSGVASGMLIRQTQPLYPTIAKAARVSGTVVLHATISKNGTIKDAKVVSGSPMLQQAALDAVRTWRYKPYKLSGDPIEVETNINVVFALDK